MTKQNEPTSSARSNSTLLWIAAFSTFVAIFVHAYLLREHYELRFGEESGGSLCNINAMFNCAAVTASRYSELFGIPMALLGAGANAVLFMLMGWYALTDAATDMGKKSAARLSVLVLAIVIAVTSVVMGFISVVLLRHGCPFCILAYLLSFVTLGCVWVALPKPSSAVRSAPKATVGVGSFTTAVIICAVVGLALVIANDQLKSSYKANNIDDYAKGKVEEWSVATPVKIQTIEPLVEGASLESAKMTIVEFADFRCPHCRHAAPVMNAFVSSHPDVRLEFQTWPLDGECNTSITSTNGASCLLARAVYCAQKTGGNGWAAHSDVFENQEKFMTVEAIRAYLPNVAKAAGVTPEILTTCVDAPETKVMVSKQAAVGTSLQLQGTPTIYVNGKKLEGGQVMPVLSAAYQTIVK